MEYGLMMIITIFLEELKVQYSSENHGQAIDCC